LTTNTGEAGEETVRGSDGAWLRDARRTGLGGIVASNYRETQRAKDDLEGIMSYTTETLTRVFSDTVDATSADWQPID